MLTHWQAHATERRRAEPSIAEQNVVPAIFDTQLKCSHHCERFAFDCPSGLRFRLRFWFWLWFGLELGF